MFNKNIIDNKHPSPNSRTSPLSSLSDLVCIPKRKFHQQNLTKNHQQQTFRLLCVRNVCVGSVQLYVCVSKLNLFIVSCSFFIVVRGFFSLGFEKLPFRPKFPSHVNPFHGWLRVLKLLLHVKHRHSLGPAPHRDRTMALDPSFGSFTLWEPVSHLVKVFTLFRLERIVLVITVWTQ
jgi:hypothetical protein